MELASRLEPELAALDRELRAVRDRFLRELSPARCAPLLHGWPTLRRRLDETQEEPELIDQLRTASRQWNSKGRSADLLWRGDTADEAKKFRKRYKVELSDVERAFLDEIINYEAAVQKRRRTAVVRAAGPAAR